MSLLKRKTEYGMRTQTQNTILKNNFTYKENKHEINVQNFNK